MTFAFPDIEAPGARWCPPAPPPPSPVSAPRPALASLASLCARVRRYNSDVEPDSPRFRAAVLLLAGTAWGQNVDRLARRTGYERSFVARCARRLIDNGVWRDGRTIAEWSSDDEASGAFWNDVGVAEGLLCRRTGADGVLEWAPPGYWNKNYQFIDPAGDPGLSVRYTDATPAPAAGTTTPAGEPESGPSPARDGSAKPGTGEKAEADRPADGPVSGPQRAPSLDEVFTDVVWIR